MSNVTSPIILDETGQAIVDAITQSGLVQDKITQINNAGDAKIQEIIETVVVDPNLSIEGAAADAKAAGDAVNDLKSELNYMLFADDCPWIKELYINEAGKTADVAKVNNIQVYSTGFVLRFSNSTGLAFTATTLQFPLSDKPYQIVPIYNIGDSQLNPGTNIYGYIIADFSWLTANTPIIKNIKEQGYNIDFSPRIKAYISSVVYDSVQALTDFQKAQARANIGAAADDGFPVFKSKMRLVDTEHKSTNVDFTTCTNQTTNTTPLYTNGFVAENDCVLLGVRTIATVNKLDVFVAKGRYADSFEWRCFAVNVPVIQSKVVEETVDNITAWVSSYNLEVKAGDEVYIRFKSGKWAYSGNTGNSYNALANLSATSVMSVNYAVSFNLIYADLEDEYDDTSVQLGLNICTIGDSLTQGVDIYKHVYAESYPFWLSRYLGSKVLNYGQMGRTVQTWWNNYKNYYSYDPSIDVVLIMFGTNGGLSTNTLATDVEPYNDWNDYADSNCGDYCKLIEYIMEQTNNHAQIFLIVPPHSTYTTAQDNTVIASESVIRAIAKKYSLPVIDVLNECGMNKFNGAMFRPNDGCHFNAKGYHRLGTFIGSKVKAHLSNFSLTDAFEDEYIGS